MSGLREYINEVISSGKRVVTYNTIESSPSSSKLKDIRKWLSGIGVPEVSGLPQELHFIVKMYNDTMELELWIPFSEKDEILYRFNYRSGELDWVLVREYKNHLGGNISDIPGNNKRQMDRVFSNIAEQVYNYLNKGVNEAISSGKYTITPKLAALDRLMTTPKPIMLSEMEKSPNVTVLEPKAGKSLEDYIYEENWQAVKHRFCRQGKCYFYYDLGSDFVYIVTKDWLFTISYMDYSDKLKEMCMYRTSDGSHFYVKQETIADCIIDYLGI